MIMEALPIFWISNYQIVSSYCSPLEDLGYPIYCQIGPESVFQYGDLAQKLSFCQICKVKNKLSLVDIKVGSVYYH